MPTKPLLRGHLHQAAFFFALGACAMLLGKSHGSGSILVYSLSLTGLLGVSALYHRPQWGAEARKRMRKLDHASIFVLIGGTVTPICRLGLRAGYGDFLALSWLAVGVGVLQSLFWVNAPKWVAAVLSVGVGCIAFAYLPALRNALTSREALLVVAGGAIYVLGAAVYALKRPDPFPRVFGYHEVFHLLVVVAAALQFLAIDSLVSRA